MYSSSKQQVTYTVILGFLLIKDSGQTKIPKDENRDNKQKRTLKDKRNRIHVKVDP